MTVDLLRRAFLVTVPLALGVLLWWHPPGGEDVYEGVSPDAGTWLFVHTGVLLFMPLLGLAAFMLLRGLESRAATVSRVSLVLFLVFYTAYEVTIGVGTGFLVDYANGLPPEEQAVVADAIQEYNRNAVTAEPASISLIAGFLGWVVAMVAAAFAFRRAGAGWPITLLVGGAALFAVHPPPVGPIGLLSLVAAAILVERWRVREARSPELAAEPAALAPSA
jgi:lysylphosphatidylglycerol synthetase-like protein (DUF2156 family)